MSRMSQQAVQRYRAQRALRPVEITYRRGSNSVQLVVIAGMARFDVTDDRSRADVRVTSPDWLLLASELVINGNATVPMPGDVIEVDADTKYEVPSKWNGQQCWRWSDPSNQIIRLHSIQIAGI